MKTIKCSPSVTSSIATAKPKAPMLLIVVVILLAITFATVYRFSTVGKGITAVGLLCGNGQLDNGEECDDGNRQNGDGCSSTCRKEEGGTPAACGNGIVEPPEECEPPGPEPSVYAVRGLPIAQEAAQAGNPCCSPTCRLLQRQTTCGRGACTRTIDECQGGGFQQCAPGTPSPEVCNGIDDDCDGRVDEDLGIAACGVGECRRTAQNC